MKAYTIAGFLSSVWNNYMSLESKFKVTSVRPTMTYTTGTLADIKSIKRKLYTLEKMILRKLARFTLYDRQRNGRICELCKVNDIVKWSKYRCREWNALVDQMDEIRLAKISRDGRPVGTRIDKRPRKRRAENWLFSGGELVFSTIRLRHQGITECNSSSLIEKEENIKLHYKKSRPAEPSRQPPLLMDPHVNLLLQ